jgi:beta-lactam-binding protein with PASTA domain
MAWSRFDPQAVGDALADLVRPKGRPRKVTVPDVLGLPVREARLVLTRVGLRSEVLRDDPHPPPVEGRVALQEPDPGTKVRRRSRVRLVLTFPREA